MGDTVKCEHCKRERSYECHNTRDMEDFAIDGDRECFYQLVKSGVIHDCGGEKGIRYVVLNCEARAKRHAAGVLPKPPETA